MVLTVAGEQSQMWFVSSRRRLGGETLPRVVTWGIFSQDSDHSTGFVPVLQYEAGSVRSFLKRMIWEDGGWILEKQKTVITEMDQ